jgi:hypothetical protein
MEQEGFKEFFGGPSLSSTTNHTPLPPGTPNTERNLFGDEKLDAQSSRRTSARNPFTSPSFSRPPSSFDSASALGRGAEGRGQRYFHSRRVKKGEIEKPWLQRKDPKEKWVTILPIIGIVIGLGVSGFLVWDGIRSVVKHNYCPVLQEDFSNGLNPAVWTKEVQVGGFGYVFRTRLMDGAFTRDIH